ncbi:MAG: PIN domain-containing protein [Treponema sp.]|nr:PIN domain-containing protein [Treponema sp.]
MDYVVDACAIIAFLNDEPGAGTVARLLNQAETGADRLFMSSVQVLEVYYDRIYVRGREYADTVLDSLYASPIIVLPRITHDAIREAGKFKTSYSMSLADALAAATTKTLAATLVTKDSELKAAEEAGEFPILWLA